MCYLPLNLNQINSHGGFVQLKTKNVIKHVKYIIVPLLIEREVIMSDIKILLTESNVLGMVGFWAYNQCPNHAPRKIETVMNKLKSAIEKDFVLPLTSDKTFYIKEIEQDLVYEYIYKLLTTIPEFKEWNLSQTEYDNGIKVDDERRPLYGFTSAFDIRDENYWKNNFVDLDAFINNVVRGLFELKYLDDMDRKEFVNLYRSDYKIRNINRI